MPDESQPKLIEWTLIFIGKIYDSSMTNACVSVNSIEGLNLRGAMEAGYCGGRTWVFIRPRGGGERFPSVLVDLTLFSIIRLVNSTATIFQFIVSMRNIRAIVWSC